MTVAALARLIVAGARPEIPPSVDREQLARLVAVELDRDHDDVDDRIDDGGSAEAWQAARATWLEAAASGMVDPEHADRVTTAIDRLLAQRAAVVASSVASTPSPPIRVALSRSPAPERPGYTLVALRSDGTPIYYPKRVRRILLPDEVFR
jgi:hypothetical protein